MKRKKEAGQALIAAVVGLGIVLMGFAGLGIDMGYLRYEKRLQQTAADSAAIAGANNIGPGGITAGAQAAAAANGFADGTNNVTVTVNNGPASGPHAADTKYVEVLVAAVQPTFFMRILGINNQTVTARAVATNLSSTTGGGGCLYTLGQPSSSITGVNINGNATLNASTCGIVDNGNFDPTGGALNVNAGTFGVAGACQGSGCGKASVSCQDQSATDCPAYGAPAGGDPFATLTPPCSPCTGGGALNPANGSTVNPGTYASISIGPGTVAFNPGAYVIDNSDGKGVGLNIGANATVTGTGVMFYFTNGATVNMVGTPTLQLIAPSPANCAACAAQYDGVLFYQDANDTSGPTFGGNSSSFYDGALYFPKAEVTFFGNGNMGDVAIVVADGLALSGHPTVTLQGSAGLPSGVSIVKTSVLVE